MKKHAAAIPFAAALFAVGPALAQDVKINVTGSNIKRVDTETAAPIETISREDIQASGLQTIAAVVQSITANNNGTISNAFINGFAAGASGVSLRGLGANNTLVLLNGRRLAVYGLADDGQRSFVDLNQVPFDAVERIEILKDGASAIYGSDAVAGVVNIILREQYTGVTATASGGTTYKGDGDQFRGAITAGIGDLTKDRYNAFITIDGQKQNSIPTSNRRQYVGTNDLTFMGLPDSRPGNPLSGYGTASLVGNVRPVNSLNPNGPAGAYQSLPGCAAANMDDQGFCRWDTKDYLQIQPTTENINVLAKGAYQINATTQAYAEFSYFQSKVTTSFTPQGVRSTWYNTAGSTVVSSSNIYLPVGHPDNPFNADDQVARLYYAAADVGGRNSTFQDDTQRYLLGIKGTNWGWDWDAGAMYITNDGKIRENGYLNYQNLLQALNGQGGFGYYRIGANANLNNPAIYSYIAPALSFDTRSENTQFDFKASRDLMKLEGGQLGLAVGAEFRREELSNPGENEVYLGNVIGLGYSSAQASRNVTALYGELYAPLLKNLEVTAALRYDNYTDYGSNWAPKVGVKYTPVRELVLRGTYSTGFRAPGPYESGNSATNGFTSVVDPVRCPITDSPADCGSGTAGVIAIGNPQLQPEKSQSWTAGLVWEPVPGLSGTLDYWNIETKQVINGADAQLVVNDPAAFPNALVLRDTNNIPGIPNSGTVLAVATPFLNDYKQKTDGIDLSARYRFDMKTSGALTTALEWTHILHFTREYNDGTSYEYAGTHGPTALSSSAGIPQDRLNVTLGWEMGPWNVTGIVRYVGPMDTIEAKELPECLQPDFNNCTVASFTTLDLSAAYKGFKNWEIFGSVINVFNRIAPLDVQAAYGGYNYNYNYANSGATGTQFFAGARFTFN
jgi:iron complex outermembrane receptor protein